MFDRRTEADAEVRDELYARSGAVVIGKRMFDVGVEPWGDPPPFGMPVFVVTHERRDPMPMQGGTTYTSSPAASRRPSSRRALPPAGRTSGSGEAGA